MAIGRLRTRSFGSIGARTIPLYRLYVYNTPQPMQYYPLASYSLGDEWCFDELHQGPPYREGGPLGIWRHNLDGSIIGPHFDVRSNSNGTPVYHYVGNFAIADGIIRDLLSPPTGWEEDFGDCQQYESTAWNKFKPGKPKAGLSVFLAELREFPSLFKFKLSNFRDVGKNYLNAQFGWVPFVNDVRKFIDLTHNLSVRLRNIRKNNGKWIRRGGDVTSSSSSTVSTGYTTGLHPSFVSGFYTGITNPHQNTLTTTVDQRVWFSGAFKYYIPNVGDPAVERRLIRQLYGLTLTPDVLWELVPYSWLVDWCTNLGDVISNLTNGWAENLVAKYAYLMSETRLTKSVVASQTFKDCYANAPSIQTVTHELSSYFLRRERSAASPYGFGVTWDGFSARQLSILAALGISRL